MVLSATRAADRLELAAHIGDGGMYTAVFLVIAAPFWLPKVVSTVAEGEGCGNYTESKNCPAPFTAFTIDSRSSLGCVPWSFLTALIRRHITGGEVG